jgi:hypothetical protein
VRPARHAVGRQKERCPDLWSSVQTSLLDSAVLINGDATHRKSADVTSGRTDGLTDARTVNHDRCHWEGPKARHRIRRFDFVAKDANDDAGVVPGAAAAAAGEGFSDGRKS